MTKAALVIEMLFMVGIKKAETLLFLSILWPYFQSKEEFGWTRPRIFRRSYAFSERIITLRLAF